ncbi:MAG: undecaprenyl-diphosphate phosphatase [Lachnospiraceae bacterium]|nr:undecaprenyl-diphosphate phosphatase [Lachnospiraceae bacterium]
MEAFLELLKSIFLGVIQGVTEFLPISSSGHLAIFKQILGMEEIGNSFDIFLHIGTLAAVFICYWRDIWKLFLEGIGILADSFSNVVLFLRKLVWSLSRKTSDEKYNNVRYKRVINSAYRKFVMLVIVSTIPTGLIGFFGNDVIEMAGQNLLVPGICLLITATLLLISDNLPDGDKTPKKVSYANAIFVGIAQGIATLPGISRSGTSITAELVCGFRRDFAVKYSFIMSIPAIIGAAIFKIKGMGSEGLGTLDYVNYIVGAVVAGVVGYICIKKMLDFVKGKKFKYFAYYCYVLGTICIVAFAYNVIKVN